jgi:shikimate dehydrogenase
MNVIEPLPIQGDTSLFLVIGDPIAHSNSPRMHNAAYRAANLPCVMAAARVSLEALPDAVKGVRALSMRGLACTMPLKTALCTLVDTLDPIAKAIGSVNTVTNHDGVLTGYNTDWIGIQRPLEKRLSLSGRRIAILGAGGAAHAAVYACRMRGSTITIFNRTESKAAMLAERFGVLHAKLDESVVLRDFDIIINATSLGMADMVDASPLTPSQLCSHHLVFETIYKPQKTKLLEYAADAGAQIVYGWEMFLEQGAAQFEILTNATAPRDVMALTLGVSE